MNKVTGTRPGANITVHYAKGLCTPDIVLTNLALNLDTGEPSLDMVQAAVRRELDRVKPDSFGKHTCVDSNTRLTAVAESAYIVLHYPKGFENPELEMRGLNIQAHGTATTESIKWFIASIEFDKAMELLKAGQNQERGVFTSFDVGGGLLA